MALQSITDINVDFYNKKHLLINAKQYDKNSRFVSVTCYNHGDIYLINANEHSVYVRYRKSDNQGVFNVCEISSDGKVLVELTEQMLASEGICYADLVIVDKGNAVVDVDNGVITKIDSSSVLSTMTFCIDVSGTAVENSEIESSNEYHGLSELLIKAEADYNDVILTSKSWAVGGTNMRDGENVDNAKYYCEQSLNSANSAANSAESAENSMNAASISERNALEYMNNTNTYMNSASKSATNASTSATSASSSEVSAKGYAATAQNSMNSAVESASSASTSAANAYNYWQQAETIVGSLDGAFSPKGTISFDELISLKENGIVAAGYLYQISEDFTTDENFRVSGKVCGAGTSVYYTADDKFDVFVGATVAGVKGNNETGYRTGVVNLTADNIGAVSASDIATVDEVTNYLGI